MTDLDEEAKRLAAAHPWAGTGATETRRTAWQPQHAVPRRPTVAKPLDADIEARVAADLARLDRELDLQAPVYRMTATEVLRQRENGMRRMRADYSDALRSLVGDTWFTDPNPLTGGWIHDEQVADPFAWTAADRAAAKLRNITLGYVTDARGDVIYTPAPPKQRKPKTYVAPGRKAGRTWIARLEQSKQARRTR